MDSKSYALQFRLLGPGFISGAESEIAYGYVILDDTQKKVEDGIGTEEYVKDKLAELIASLKGKQRS